MADALRIEVMRRRRWVLAWRWRLVRPWPGGPLRSNPAFPSPMPRLPEADRATVVAEGWAWTKERAFERARWATPEVVDIDGGRDG